MQYEIPLASLESISFKLIINLFCHFKLIKYSYLKTVEYKIYVYMTPQIQSKQMCSQMTHLDPDPFRPETR